MMPVLRLAIPTPLRTLFDYRPAENMDSASLRPGQRFRAPFGSREVSGYLVEVVDDDPDDGRQLKPVIEQLDAAPLLPDSLLALCRWAAAYYLHPPGEVLSAAFPTALRRGQPHRPLSTDRWQLTTRGMGLPRGALGRSPRQAEALAMLQQHGSCAADQLRSAGIRRAVLRSLQDKGLVEPDERPPVAAPAHAHPGPVLTDEQAATVAAVAAIPGFRCHLLEGVTGSGKTEIYLQLIARCLERGEQALLLVPEIGLTPQTLARFQRRFDAEIAVLHSGLSEAQRYRAWEAARSGLAHIVIGTRSAVFTPLARPGLIVVDEEHDSSFKQQDGFRYNARDVAIKRGQLEACPVLLGSATPALESLNNVLEGRYDHHRLRQRAGGSTLPTIRLLDLRRQPLTAGFSEPLLAAMRDNVDRGLQCLLFLNRRGYAPTLQCHDCGWIANCDHCDARLTLHRREGRLRCHHCGMAMISPSGCPDCHSEQLLSLGLGTEQAEDYLRDAFRGTPVYRVDSDSMQGRESMQDLVTQVRSGEPCILLGTQMLTKGHHFPGVALVAVLDMDAMLFSTDFRGEERAAQLLTQVAGRAGRAEVRGEVILQSHHPDHPALRAMLDRDYHDFARRLLEDRQRRALPPAGSMAMVRTDCADASTGEAFLAGLRSDLSGRLPPGVQMIGPLPAPMQRRAGRFRSQLLLHAPQRAPLHAAARLLVEQAGQRKAGRGLNWSIDIDPLELS
jgi:primosomal protein N' (replication factor Y)